MRIDAAFQLPPNLKRTDWISPSVFGRSSLGTVGKIAKGEDPRTGLFECRGALPETEDAIANADCQDQKRTLLAEHLQLVTTTNWLPPPTGYHLQLVTRLLPGNPMNCRLSLPIALQVSLWSEAEPPRQCVTRQEPGNENNENSLVTRIPYGGVQRELSKTHALMLRTPSRVMLKAQPTS